MYVYALRKEGGCCCDGDYRCDEWGIVLNCGDCGTKERFLITIVRNQSIPEYPTCSSRRQRSERMKLNRGEVKERERERVRWKGAGEMSCYISTGDDE